MPEPNPTYQTLRELLAKATPGPWHRKSPFEIECPHGEDEAMTCYGVCDADENTAYIQVCGMECFAAPNSALIVAAVNALPALLDVAEAAQRWMANELDRKRPWTPDAMELRDALHKLRALAALEGVTT